MMSNPVILRDTVRSSTDQYLKALDGEQATGLYRMTLDVVEDQLLRSVMWYVKGNQTVATRILTISRATLRKKLQERNILYYGRVGGD